MLESFVGVASNLQKAAEALEAANDLPSQGAAAALRSEAVAQQGLLKKGSAIRRGETPLRLLRHNAQQLSTRHEHSPRLDVKHGPAVLVLELQTQIPQRRLRLDDAG